MEGKKSMKQQRRREIAAKNKELRCVKKAGKEKILWGRLQELNTSFANMKENNEINKKRKIQL